VQRLQTLLTPRVNEGFFARTVVLVEGEDDCAAIMGAASAKGVDLEAEGVSVIPLGGKRNLDRAALIFREFGIRAYLVWDADAGKGEMMGRCAQCNKPLEGKHDTAENRRLLRIVGATEEDWPERLTTTFCCFKVDLETTLRQEIGPAVFDKLLAQYQTEFGIPKPTHGVKNPKLIAAIMEGARKEGHESATLSAIVDHVMVMAKTAPPVMAADSGEAPGEPEPEFALAR
jgi:putative ATP-dependent endonuclease of the OLD family